MPSRRARTGSLSVMSCSRTSSVPASGWWAPVTTLMSVDLPAPFSPTRACTSPGRRSKETPLSACTPANDLRTPVRHRSGFIFLVPTLCVGMLASPLRGATAGTRKGPSVPREGRSRAAERRKLHSHAERGNEGDVILAFRPVPLGRDQLRGEAPERQSHRRHIAGRNGVSREQIHAETHRLKRVPVCAARFRRTVLHPNANSSRLPPPLQYLPLVTTYCLHPCHSYWHALGRAMIIPYRPERQRLQFLQACEPSGEIAGSVQRA